MDDFLAAQLAACGPLDAIEFWLARHDGGRSDLALEVVREEDHAFTVSVGAAFADRTVVLASLGLGERPSRLDPTTPGDVASLVRDALLAFDGTGARVSLAHVRGEEVGRRRRLEATVAGIHGYLAERLPLNTWRASFDIPFGFPVDGIDVTVWPKEWATGMMLEVWTCLGFHVPDTAEVATFVANCNAGFMFGRIVRQERQLWYRDIIHAEPLGRGAFDFAVDIAVDTARKFGPVVAELGGVDGTAPAPSPPGAPPRSPATSDNRGGYL